MDAQQDGERQIQSKFCIAARQPHGFMNRGALDVEAADRTYRILDRKGWEKPIRDAVAATGAAIVDDGKGWRRA